MLDFVGFTFPSWSRWKYVEGFCYGIAGRKLIQKSTASAIIKTDPIGIPETAGNRKAGDDRICDEQFCSGYRAECGDQGYDYIAVSARLPVLTRRERMEVNTIPL